MTIFIFFKISKHNGQTYSSRASETAKNSAGKGVGWGGVGGVGGGRVRERDSSVPQH